MATLRDPAKFWTGITTVVAIVAFWLIGSQAGWIDAQSFPSPEPFAAAARQLLFGEGFADGRIHEHILHRGIHERSGFAACR